jgi:hypothetical protein
MISKVTSLGNGVTVGQADGDETVGEAVGSAGVWVRVATGTADVEVSIVVGCAVTGPQADINNVNTRVTRAGTARKHVLIERLFFNDHRSQPRCSGVAVANDHTRIFQC